MPNRRQFDHAVTDPAQQQRLRQHYIRTDIVKEPPRMVVPRPARVTGPRSDLLTPAPSMARSGYPQKRAAIFFSDVDHPDVKFEIANPDWYIGVDYPIEVMLGLQMSGELLKSVATESGGAATATLAPTAGLYAEVHALEITFQQSTFQTPQGGGRVTIKFAPKTANAGNVRDTFDTLGSAEELLEISADWSSPADGLQRRFYALLARRIAGLGRTVPEVAMLRTPAAGAGDEVAPLDITCSFENLASGSGIQFVVQACTPGTLPYERLLRTLQNQFGEG